MGGKNPLQRAIGDDYLLQRAQAMSELKRRTHQNISITNLFCRMLQNARASLTEVQPLMTHLSVSFGPFPPSWLTPPSSAPSPSPAMASRVRTVRATGTCGHGEAVATWRPRPWTCWLWRHAGSVGGDLSESPPKELEDKTCSTMFCRCFGSWGLPSKTVRKLFTIL